jgi:hypothetical protein
VLQLKLESIILAGLAGLLHFFQLTLQSLYLLLHLLNLTITGISTRLFALR